MGYPFPMTASPQPSHAHHPGAHSKPSAVSALHCFYTQLTPLPFEPAEPVARGVAYVRGGQPGARRADVYLPTGAQKGSVVLVHGGGWVVGSRGMKPVRFLATRFVEAGFAVCSVGYRRIHEGGDLDSSAADVGEGLSWWRDRAGRFGHNPERVALCGISAGATLSLLAASDPRAEGLGGLVSIFGLYDFAKLRGAVTSALLRLVLRTGERAVWSARSPMNAAPCPAPMLAVHGTEDRLVPVAQAEALVARQRAEGLSAELRTYEGAPHGFFNLGDARAERATQDIVSFLKAHLYY
jgi:acetyl esterase/lipase